MLQLVTQPQMDIWLPWIYCIPMSTAIVKIYTPDGFVVAADGHTDSGKTDAQKIFAINSVGTLAYCLSNCAAISDAETGVDIQFAELCKFAADEPRLKNVSDLQRYADVFSRTFGKQALEQVDEAKQQGLIGSEGRRLLKGGWETHLHFIGYFKGSPSMGMSKVAVHHGKVSVSHSFYPLGSTVQAIFYGSELVIEALRCNDPRFAKYASGAFVKAPESVPDAIDAATKYIAACSEPVARELDVRCNSIGGQIHIATITLLGGFQWVEPPVAARAIRAK